MATLFMLEQQIKHNEDYPLLSCDDIIELLVHDLPNRKVAEEEVFRQFETRHHRKQMTIDFSCNPIYSCSFAGLM